MTIEIRVLGRFSVWQEGVEVPAGAFRGRLVRSLVRMLVVRRGSFVSLGAPGTSIIPFGNLNFGVQGTSVSSAYTSGLAAGFLESSGGNVSKMESFLNNNFGVKITPAHP